MAEIVLIYREHLTWRLSSINKIDSFKVIESRPTYYSLPLVGLYFINKFTSANLINFLIYLFYWLFAYIYVTSGHGFYEEFSSVCSANKLVQVTSGLFIFAKGNIWIHFSGVKLSIRLWKQRTTFLFSCFFRNDYVVICMEVKMKILNWGFSVIILPRRRPRFYLLNVIIHNKQNISTVCNYLSQFSIRASDCTEKWITSYKLDSFNSV